MNRVEPVREWVGGRFALPAKVESMGDRRAEMSLWVELPDLHVVGHVLEDSQDPEATFGQSLMRAMASPLFGAPRRPQRVRVADAVLAEQLKSFSFLDVEVAPTPEFDKVVRSLGAFFGQGSYFSDPSLTPNELERFFVAARVFWAARPWTLIEDDALVKIEIPAMGIDDGCVSIVGALDEVHGFVFFPSYEDYDRMTENAASLEPGEAVAAHQGLYFSFVPSGEVPEAMRKEVVEHGWPLADEEAYPVLERMADGKPAPVFVAEVQLATAIMRALAACLLRNPQAFESYGDVELRESHVDENDLEVILSLPHPRVTLDDGFEPPPRAPTLSAENPYGLPLEAAQRKELERTLRQFTIHRVVGMFCAVASVPQLVPPRVWLGEIFAGLDLANEAEFRRTVDQLMFTYQHVVSTLERTGIDGLVPEAEDVGACRHWACGYASLLRNVDRAQMEGELIDSVFAIEALTESPAALQLLDEVRGEKSREEMLVLYRASLADDAGFLYEEWAEARATPPPEATMRRAPPKVGRNDPCPCGSGKKYKKCCAVSSS